MKTFTVSKVILWAGVLVCIGMIFQSEASFARDLVAASNTATNTVKNVGRAISALGVISGGILMQIPGAAEYGKRTLGAGLLGCLCTFGGPALIHLIGDIFGS